MAVLQIEPERKEVLIGAYVSKRVHSYFTLYTLAKGESKSRILNTLFLDWISRQKEIDSETELLKQIVLRVRKTRSKFKNKGMDINMFKKVIEAELMSKGVSENYVALILSEII